MLRHIIPIVLLLISNVFMTFAWYGHLKFRSLPLLIVILASWGIAFFEYCFQVPANRIGYECYNAVQLKTIQEVITLTVFSFFSVLYLKEQFRWNYLVGFVFIILAVFFIFKKWLKFFCNIIINNACNSISINIWVNFFCIFSKWVKHFVTYYIIRIYKAFIKCI